jgi:hypothetical protein
MMQFALSPKMFNELSDMTEIKGYIYYSTLLADWAACISIDDREVCGHFEYNEDVYRLLHWIPTRVLKEMEENGSPHIQLPRELIVNQLICERKCRND